MQIGDFQELGGKREAEMGSIVKWIWELKNIPQHSDLKKKYNLSKYNEIPLLLEGKKSTTYLKIS